MPTDQLLDLLDLGFDRFGHVDELIVNQQAEAFPPVLGIDPEAVEDDALAMSGSRGGARPLLVDRPAEADVRISTFVLVGPAPPGPPW